MKDLKVIIYRSSGEIVEKFYTSELCWCMFDRQRVLARFGFGAPETVQGQYRQYINSEYELEVTPVENLPF